MIINKLKIENYKIFTNKTIVLNKNMNIFIGENDSGKSTILELICILTTGKLNNYAFEKQLKASMFNVNIRNNFIKSVKETPKESVPPIIRIEAYCDNDERFAEYKGTNNSLGEDCPGISVLVELDQEYAKEYKVLVSKGEVYDIPVEFYTVQYKYFKGDKVHFKYCPFKTSFIDATRKDYSNTVNRFVSDNISSYLSDKERIDLSVAYRKNKNEFRLNQSVKKLNNSMKENIKLSDKEISIDLKEGIIDEWKNEMSLSVDEIPFENIGFGSQNIIKLELSLKNDSNETNVILMEEPENNLSYGNMAKLIAKVQENNNKQIFVSTHSSFVANKLGLKSLILMSKGQVSPLKNLDDDTMNYFKKLPGYDTLRLVLANEVILVEGPADDLITERAYYDEYSKLPIEDGIDVIVVDSLAFKRYCDIALLINKKIKIVTDNDSNIKKNIEDKYKDYLEKKIIYLFYEKNENFKTLEPSVVNANSQSQHDFEIFKEVISKNKSMMTNSKDEVLSFMLNNKTEWSLRVFDHEKKIKYPEYIKNAIKK